MRTIDKGSFGKYNRARKKILVLSAFVLLFPFFMTRQPVRSQESSPQEGDTQQPRIVPLPDWPKKITIGFIPSLTPDQTRRKWQPLLDHLEKTLGLKVDTFVPDNYIRLIAALKTGQVDFVYFGPQSYVEARRLTGAEVIAMELDQEGNPGYRAIIISDKNSGIQTLEQARGKVLAFTDPDSTSGYLVPLVHFIRDRKQTPASFASRIVFAGSHTAVIQGVASGEYAAGATNDMDLVRSTSSLGIDPDRFNILWKSELIPGSPFAARKDIPQSLKTAFLEAMLAMNQDQAALDKMEIGGFEAARDSDFDLIRELEKLKLK